MDSFWRQTVVDGKAGVLNYFAVGDSAVRSNPKYGRGCTWSTVSAHHVSDLLAQSLSAHERIIRYEQILEGEFREDWRTMRSMDQSSETAFEVATSRRRKTASATLTTRFQEVFNTALVLEPALFRSVWRGYHGMAGMKDWMKDPCNWWYLARSWAGGHGNQQVVSTARQRPSHVELSGG
jgi:hypothetical protein